MHRCAGFKRSGERCTATVTGPSDYCWHHDPRNSEQRSRAASKAGRSRPSREIATVKTEIHDLIGDVIAGRIPQGRAAVAFQGYNAFMRAADLQRAIVEQEDLLERLDRLEAAYEGRTG